MGNKHNVRLTFSSALAIVFRTLAVYLLVLASLRLSGKRDIGHKFDESLTFGQKVSDSIARSAGSCPFIIFFFVFLGTWIVINSILLPAPGEAFDLYPYFLLNLFLSKLAAVQAPIIIMVANRKAAKDLAEAAHDYEINLKAELEVMSLHAKIDQMPE